MPIKLTPQFSVRIFQILLIFSLALARVYQAQDKGPNFVGIANEGTAELFSMQIPNFDGVPTATDESLPIRTQGNGQT